MHILIGSTKKLHFKSIEDWYDVTRRDFADNYGGALVNNYYAGSPTVLLKNRYPEFDWKIFKFKQTTKKFWANSKNTLDYLNWLYDELGFSSMDDWYGVTNHDYAANHGQGLMLYYSRENKSISDIVVDHFPDYNWRKMAF